MLNASQIWLADGTFKREQGLVEAKLTKNIGGDKAVKRLKIGPIKKH